MRRKGGDYFFNAFRFTWLLTILGCGAFGYYCFQGSFLATLIFTVMGVVLGLITGIVGPLLLIIIAIAGLLSVALGILG